MDRIKEIEERVNDTMNEYLPLFNSNGEMREWNQLFSDLKYLLEENKRLREEIGTALYELKRLERNIDIPERGYVRNCFNSVVRTLEQALREDTCCSSPNHQTFDRSEHIETPHTLCMNCGKLFNERMVRNDRSIKRCCCHF